MSPETKTRAEAMAAYYNSGETLRDVGARYGVTGEYVRQILRKIGVERRSAGGGQPDPVVAMRRALVAALVADDMSRKTISHLLGVRRCLVSADFASMGIPRPVLRARHGAVSKYSSGCRCERCRLANGIYSILLRYERRQRGKCCKCASLAESGRASCAKHLAVVNEYARRRKIASRRRAA